MANNDFDNAEWQRKADLDDALDDAFGFTEMASSIKKALETAAPGWYTSAEIAEKIHLEDKWRDRFSFDMADMGSIRHAGKGRI